MQVCRSRRSWFRPLEFLHCWEGLSILLGYRAKIGAWLVVLFLVPVTLMMHNFWAVKDPMMAQMQMAMFLKNVTILEPRCSSHNLEPGR